MRASNRRGRQPRRVVVGRLLCLFAISRLAIRYVDFDLHTLLAFTEDRFVRPVPIAIE
jgi:hypothetical protein